MCHLPKFSDPDLIVGFDTSDDAAVYRISDDNAIIQSVDIFPPVVDDPYDYGAIAASNALSDIYAMGGKPKLAMNILCVPADLDKSIVEEILRGGYDKVKEAGAIVCGGHSIKDKEPKYGLSVTGFVHPDKVLKNVGLKENDVLILTKPLGTGILNTAAKAGLISDSSVQALVDSMKELNSYAAEVMNKYDVHCCTDITGFGLLGHTFEMAHGSRMCVEILSENVGMLPEARDMASMGIIPQGAYANRSWLSCAVKVHDNVPLDLADVLFDPQTSGGLLFAIPSAQADECLTELTTKGIHSSVIGHVTGDRASSDFLINVI